jgi:hypothetical protein
MNLPKGSLFVAFLFDLVFLLIMNRLKMETTKLI